MVSVAMGGCTMARMGAYHPLRILWLAALLAALPFLVMWERGIGGVEGIIIALADLVRRYGMTWLAGFMERLAGDNMTRGMVAVLLVLLVYAILQLAGAMLDRRQLHRKHNPQKPPSSLAGILAAFTGRPFGLPVVLSAANARHGQNEMGQDELRHVHFDYGRHVLLTPLHLGLWAFPVVGFLGTVIGISGAVAHLPQVLEDNARLNQLLNNLYVAFDTTFVGLAASLFIMAMLAILDFAWDRNEIIAQHMQGAESAVIEETEEMEENAAAETEPENAAPRDTVEATQQA